MDINTIANRANKIKRISDEILNQYQDILAKLIKSYNIIAATNHPAASELKTLIDNVENKVNSFSKKYTSFSETIKNYVKSSNSNYEQLENDIYKISKNMIDAISSLK